jgi:hypothetical protein
VFIGFYSADENLNDDNEVIHADPENVHASWKSYDHKNCICVISLALYPYQPNLMA